MIFGSVCSRMWADRSSLREKKNATVIQHPFSYGSKLKYNEKMHHIYSQKNQKIGGNFYYFDDKTMLAKIEISGIIIMK